MPHLDFQGDAVRLLARQFPPNRGTKDIPLEVAHTTMDRRLLDLLSLPHSDPKPLLLASAVALLFWQRGLLPYHTHLLNSTPKHRQHSKIKDAFRLYLIAHTRHLP